MARPPRKSISSSEESQSLTGRQKFTRVLTARGRKTSSTRWLQRQLNDPYVAEARKRGYKSRAAFKLIELDDKFHFLKKGQRIVDLGAAPGGWTQVAVDRTNVLEDNRTLVIGIDVLEWGPIAGAQCITLDFLDSTAPDLLKTALNGKADVVMSDMAAPTTGHPPTDHLRIVALLEEAWAFAEDVLTPGGVFLCKVFQGGTIHDLLKQIKPRFISVKHAKPAASRKESPELYLIAQGFKG